MHITLSKAYGAEEIQVISKTKCEKKENFQLKSQQKHYVDKMSEVKRIPVCYLNIAWHGVFFPSMS